MTPPAARDGPGRAARARRRGLVGALNMASTRRRHDRNSHTCRRATRTTRARRGAVGRVGRAVAAVQVPLSSFRPTARPRAVSLCASSAEATYAPAGNAYPFVAASTTRSVRPPAHASRSSTTRSVLRRRRSGVRDRPSRDAGRSARTMPAHRRSPSTPRHATWSRAPLRAVALSLGVPDLPAAVERLGRRVPDQPRRGALPHLRDCHARRDFERSRSTVPRRAAGRRWPVAAHRLALVRRGAASCSATRILLRRDALRTPPIGREDRVDGRRAGAADLAC